MVSFLVCLLGLVLAISASWAFSYFGLSCFEQLIFHIKVPLEGTNTEFIFDWFKKCFMKAFLISFGIWVIFLWKSIQSYYGIVCWIIFWCCILYGLFKIEFVEYVMNLFRKSDLYEKYYVDGKDVELSFPKKKRNLILIYVESLETTYTSKENGGNYNDDLIPELSQLAKENLNFSHQDKLGGGHVVVGTGWTTGGMVGSSAAIPLCVPFWMKPFRDDRDFYPGITALGDILEKEGYLQELLIGSDAYFGGRKFFYDKHGNYRIFDLNEAYRQKKIDTDYHVFWGYEDEKLFSFAKEEIIRLSQENKPFNFTMLTVDTHHPKGYQDTHYQNIYPERLSNIIKENSRKVGEFINWLKQQEFYQDTTIIILGDHTSMAAEYINHTYDKKYDRTTFNVFINSQNKPKNNKNRIFTTFDYYPTILSALGIKIKNDQIGLGVNLFSSKKTIAEKIGLKKLNQELKKQSKTYLEKILHQ
ncbi:MAG: LTA synthase family protein [Traorella sp.]